MDLFHQAVPAGELDEDDWEAIRVAVRVVRETEQLRASMVRNGHLRRDPVVARWSDSVEGALTFMSWVRQLGAIVTGATHPATLPDRLSMLLRRHGTLTAMLLEADVSAPQRLSALVELGGIQISLMGKMWALRPVHDPRVVRGVNAALRQARTAVGSQGKLTEDQLEELVRTAAALSKRAPRRRKVRPGRRRS